MTKLISATARTVLSPPLGALIREAETLNYEERIVKLFEHFDADEILITSSFGVKSALLLSVLSRVRNHHPVYFVDTGFHFPETLGYKEYLTHELNLNVIDVHPDKPQHELTRKEHWWVEHPKMCCTINKIAPLKPLIEKNSVWVSNLMAFESSFRAQLKIYKRQGSIIKFHPFLDLSQNEYKATLKSLNLEKHPLLDEGYESIGCSHCTVKGNGRSGRWFGKSKTECGLHEKYFLNKK